MVVPKISVEELLKTKDLVKIYGDGPHMGEFPLPQIRGLETFFSPRKIRAYQRKKRRTLKKYDGYWFYIIGFDEWFEGRYCYGQVHECLQIGRSSWTRLSKDVPVFNYHVALTQEDYEIAHGQAEGKGLLSMSILLNGVRTIHFLILKELLCCDFIGWLLKWFKRVVVIKDQKNKEEPLGYDWTIYVSVQGQVSDHSNEDFEQALQQFWVTQGLPYIIHPSINVVGVDYEAGSLESLYSKTIKLQKPKKVKLQKPKTPKRKEKQFPVSKISVQDFLDQKTDLVVIHGNGPHLGQFPTEQVDSTNFNRFEIESFYREQGIALEQYVGYWLYVLGREEWFEGYYQHGRIFQCVEGRIVSRDVSAFDHQVTISQEDYEIVHGQWEGKEPVLSMKIQLEGTHDIFFDAYASLCRFIYWWKRRHQRVVAIYDYEHDEPPDEEPWGFDWMVYVTVQSQEGYPPPTIEDIEPAVRQFWVAQRRMAGQRPVRVYMIESAWGTFEDLY